MAGAFNAKYANFLRDCYDQFLWSLPFSLNWLIWSHFNVIISWFVTTYPLGLSGQILQSSMFSYLVSYLRTLTFLQPLQLVVVVVGFCLNFLFTMLNACVISSFEQLVSMVIHPILWPGSVNLHIIISPCPLTWACQYTYNNINPVLWPGPVNIHIIISTLSFDLGLQCFLVPFHLGSQQLSCPFHLDFQ